MDRITVTFIRASMVYLVVGTTMGVILVFWPQGLAIYRTVHAHLNVFGWLSMLVFGVAYHILPRFSGQPLYSQPLARAHLWLSNVGLIGLILFWPMAGHRPGLLANVLLSIFAVVSTLGMYAFVYNMWRTVKGLEQQS